MDAKLILVMVGVLAAASERSEAITCYSYYCDTIANSNCLDPFKADGVETCEGSTCVERWGSVSGTTAAIRNCSMTTVEKDRCTEFPSSGAKVIECFCRTDYCNDGPMDKSLKSTPYSVTVSGAKGMVKPTLCNVFIGVAMTTAWMNHI